MMSVLLGVAALSTSIPSPVSPPRLWFDKPTTEYMSGLPLGNGTIGAMVLGEPAQARIALNHQWLWRGKTRDRKNPVTAQNLPAIRQLFFEGKIIEGSNQANAELGVRPETGVDSYQPFGDLLLRFPTGKQETDYRRELDLTTGIARTSYRLKGVAYAQEVFTSRANGLLVVHLTCEKPNQLTGEIELSRVNDPECTLRPWVQGAWMGFNGRFQEGVEFAAEARVLTDGGTVSQGTMPSGRSGEVLRVQNADSVTILVGMKAGPETADLPANTPSEALKRMFRRIFAARLTRYPLLRQNQIAAHRRLFDRMHLRLGTDGKAEIPTDQRLADLKAGRPDANLEALYFHYGRYLMMSSSGRGGLPANLQGIWNDSLHPPWDADFHQDINLQMNYWPAEVTNLSECANPFFAHCERLAVNGRQAAADLYGCRGIYIPIVSDPWALCNKTQGAWSEWTGAAAWLAQHFWQHYEYTQDRQFLANRAYPFMKEVAAFYQDYLVEDPRPDSKWKGKLVPVPSYSPENQFVGGIGPVSLSIGATMDLELIHDLFTHLLSASFLLNVDADKQAGWKRILENIPPLQIGKHGQLQEWLEDYDEAEPGHRHVSHLFALFPGDQITLEETPELAKAARTSLERRLSFQGGHTGWSRSWTVGLWARLQEGDKAEEHLRHLITDFATISLLDLHPPRLFQIDGNFGGTAGIAEMLMQSHAGVVRLLPALPAAWPEGEVSGLKARGNVEVSLQWANGKATAATLKCARANILIVQAPKGQKIVGMVVNGKQSGLNTSLKGPGCVFVHCPAGKLVHLKFGE